MEWRTIEGYEGIFEVSEFGDVRRLIKRHSMAADTLLSHNLDKYGYHRVFLTDLQKQRKSFAVQRLVATAFIGPCPEGHEINHKDKNKGNNHYSNLEWVTHRRNIEHSWEDGKRRLTIARGTKTGSHKLSDDQIVEIRRLASEGMSQRQLSTKFNVSHVAIGHILRGTTWTHIP